MITLLSDFGHRDAYVAVMKGVIAGIVPKETTCDLTHQVPPQDILAARFNLMMAYPHFPKGTVHLGVVDPGVGSARRAIAIQCPNGFFVGPDNGIFSGVLQQEPVITAVSLTNPQYWRVPNPSATFHGRDIFAPAAAHLAKGVPIGELGDRLSASSLVQINLPPYTQQLESSPKSPPGTSHTTAAQPAPAQSIQYTGSLQYIDTFGNLISNFPGELVRRSHHRSPPNAPWQLTLHSSTQSHCFLGTKTYSEVPIGTLTALVGSHGWIEIACNGGSAADVLSISSVLSEAMDTGIRLCLNVA